MHRTGRCASTLNREGAVNRNGAVHLSLGDIAEIENDPVQALFYWSRYLDRCVPKPLHSHVPKVVPV